MVTGAEMVPGVRRGGVTQPSSMILLTERAALNERAAQPIEERLKRLEEMVLLRVPALEAEVERLKGVLKLQTERTGGPTTWASKQKMTMGSQTPSPSSRRWRR